MRSARFLKDHPPHKTGDIANLSVGDFYRLEESGTVEQVVIKPRPIRVNNETLETTSAPKIETRDPETAAPTDGSRRRKRI